MLWLAVVLDERSIAFLPILGQILRPNPGQPVPLPYLAVAGNLLIGWHTTIIALPPLPEALYVRSRLDPAEDLGLVFLCKAREARLHQQDVFVLCPNVIKQVTIRQPCCNKR